MIPIPNIWDTTTIMQHQTLTAALLSCRDQLMFSLRKSRWETYLLTVGLSSAVNSFLNVFLDSLICCGNTSEMLMQCTRRITDVTYFGSPLFRPSSRRQALQSLWLDTYPHLLQVPLSKTKSN